MPSCCPCGHQYVCLAVTVEVANSERRASLGIRSAERKRPIAFSCQDSNQRASDANHVKLSVPIDINAKPTRTARPYIRCQYRSERAVSVAQKSVQIR